MKNAIVSIITPSFNRGYIVDETANSIFNQTYPYWEWIIVDDGSSDNSWEMLQQYAARDSRVKIFQRNRLPKGACTCRNIAVENSTGQYLIFLDTDDLLASFCLEQRVKTFEEDPDNDFIIFPMLLFKDTPSDLGLLWNIENGVDDILRILYGDPICQGTGILWKKQAFIDIGMWDESLAVWQDIDLHLRAMLKKLSFSKYMNLLPDIFLRISEVSLSRTGYNSLLKLQSRIIVLDNALTIAAKEGSILRFKDGFRYMSIGIFMTTANKNALKEAQNIEKLIKRYDLFSHKERNILMVYFLFRKLRLYKISFLKERMLKEIAHLASSPNSLLNKEKYNKKINL